MNRLDSVHEQTSANDPDWGWSLTLYEYMCRLNRDDPDKFEAERLRLIEDVFSRSGRNAPKLRWLQEHIDLKRRRAHSPLKVCLDLSEMMWRSFYKLNERLNTLSNK